MTNNKTYEPLNPQLNTETISAQEIYKDGVCPRLDKMISQAYRILNRQEEVTDDKNKKGGKGAPPKKDDKKGAKKGGKEEVEESKQPTAEELELKKAVNTQKAILRQRLNKIKTLGTSKLRNAHESAQKLYSELEDLYIYTDKVQKKAIFGLAKIFRKSIEAEQKIESEVQIHHVAVTQTDHIRNY